jgi:uncharacterized radical SAM superfamily protein
VEDLEKLIEKLRRQPIDILLDWAWDIRTKNFPMELNVSVPSAKTYITDHYKNEKDRFVNISITGKMCQLNCEHCKRKLLESMIPAEDPEKIRSIGDDLKKKGCRGVLISGGATLEGTVPLDNYFDSIKYLKDLDMQVIVHTGLISKGTALNLKIAGVDQVLIDVIGDERTIKEVYHLDKKPQDYEDSLKNMKEAGLEIVPHIVIGLHFGSILGEYNALRFISQSNPEVIVLVALTPMYETPMQGVNLPSPEEIAKICAVARIVNPDTKITFGCARPAGPQKIELEKMLIRAGINSIAYPTDEAVDFAQSLQLKTEFKEECCSLL